PPDLGGRRESSRMVTITPHRAAASEDSVHRLRRACRESLAPAAEGRPAFGFDEEGDVVGLPGPVQQAEGGPGGCCGGLPAGRKAPRTAQGWKPAGGTQGHVYGKVAIVRRATPVRDGAPIRCRGTTRPDAAATPGSECEAALRGACHLELG